MEDELESFVNNLEKKYFDKYFQDDSVNEEEATEVKTKSVSQERKNEVGANNLKKSTVNISSLSEQLVITSGLVQAELERVILSTQGKSSASTSNSDGIDVLIDMSEHVDELLNTAKKLKELKELL